MALLTMALLTMALLTMALLTMALLTMALLPMAGEDHRGYALPVLPAEPMGQGRAHCDRGRGHAGAP